MEDLLKAIEHKVYLAELEERRMYNYWCDCSDNFTREEADKYQKRWDDVIEKCHILKDLENSLKKAFKYL